MSQLKLKKCLYCENYATEFHFQSDCCGRGMCDDCYNGMTEHDEQLQVSWTSENIKPEFEDAAYLCFECAPIWQLT